MTSCFFYKLHVEAVDFQSAEFDHEEITVSHFKEFIIKEKFDNAIGFKELDVIEYNSRKKFLDQDILKSNTYLIVTKIPKITLSSKHTSQVATIQPFIASKDTSNKNETSKADSTSFTSYEHSFSSTFSTSNSQNQLTEATLFSQNGNIQNPAINPSYLNLSTMMLTNPSNFSHYAHSALQTYPTHQAHSYVHPAHNTYLHPSSYSHMCASSLAVCPPCYPYPSTHLYPLPQHDDGLYTSPMDVHALDEPHKTHRSSHWDRHSDSYHRSRKYEQWRRDSRRSRSRGVSRRSRSRGVSRRSRSRGVSRRSRSRGVSRRNRSRGVSRRSRSRGVSRRSRSRGVSRRSRSRGVSRRSRSRGVSRKSQWRSSGKPIRSKNTRHGQDRHSRDVAQRPVKSKTLHRNVMRHATRSSSGRRGGSHDQNHKDTNITSCNSWNGLKSVVARNDNKSSADESGMQTAETKQLDGVATIKQTNGDHSVTTTSNNAIRSSSDSILHSQGRASEVGSSGLDISGEKALSAASDTTSKRASPPHPSAVTPLHTTSPCRRKSHSSRRKCNVKTVSNQLSPSSYS